MNNKKEIIKFRLDKKKYFEELAVLCLEKPDEKSLASLDLTEKIRNEILNKEEFLGKKFAIDFAEKRSARFKKYIGRLDLAIGTSIYIWTERSNSCGTYQVSSLHKINFDFPADLNKEGIFVLLASDFSNRLIFDFSRRADSSEYDLELEAIGPDWSKINY